MLIRLGSLVRREAGQALAEYTLIIAFIAAVSVAALTALGLVIGNPFGALVPYL